MRDILLNKEYLLLLLLAVNGLFFFKALKVPIDYDTANHLYFAFLKYKKIPFISSYKPGIKYILPRIYSFFMPFMKENYKWFRIINFLSSSILIGLLILVKKNITQQDVIIYFIFVLMINSLWFDYTKSASEFHEPVFIILLMLLPEYLQNPYLWVIQILIIVFATISFKVTFAVYLIPATYISNIYQENIYWTLIGAFIIGVIILYIYKMKSANVNSYSKTRKFLNPKNIRTILINPLFVFFLAFIFYKILSEADLRYSLFLISALFIFFVQRNYTNYFYYPLFVISAFIIFISENNFLNVPNEFLVYVFLYILIINSICILILSAKNISICTRVFFMFDLGWITYLSNRQEQIEWINNNINKNSYVYLWGSNVYLLLQSRLKHVPNTYYSHNHLFYWSVITDKVKYAVEIINKNMPEYIIESKTIENNNFPNDLFENKYLFLVQVHDMKIYKKINK